MTSKRPSATRLYTAEKRGSSAPKLADAMRRRSVTPCETAVKAAEERRLRLAPRVAMVETDLAIVGSQCGREGGGIVGRMETEAPPGAATEIKARALAAKRDARSIDRVLK
jgi:hypothetical protein